jgi:hypothetical protein
VELALDINLGNDLLSLVRTFFLLPPLLALNLAFEATRTGIVIQESIEVAINVRSLFEESSLSFT